MGSSGHPGNSFVGLRKLGALSIPSSVEDCIRMQAVLMIDSMRKELADNEEKLKASLHPHASPGRCLKEHTSVGDAA